MTENRKPPSSGNRQPQQQLNELDRDQFELWKIHPVTVAYFREFREIRSALIESLSSGQLLTGNAMETAEAVAKVSGEIRGLNHLLGAYFEDEKGVIYAMPD